MNNFNLIVVKINLIKCTCDGFSEFKSEMLKFGFYLKKERLDPVAGGGPIWIYIFNCTDFVNSDFQKIREIFHGAANRCGIEIFIRSVE